MDLGEGNERGPFSQKSATMQIIVRSVSGGY